MSELRRVITGHGPDGRSKVSIDSAPLDGVAPLLEVWAAQAGPVDSRDEADLAAGPVRLCPSPGGSKFRYFTVEPLPAGLPPEAVEAAFAQGFAAIGAADARVDTRRHPAMHRTSSLDYIIVLKGEVTLLLDDGEVHLKPFDVVVQRGTNHGWVATGPEPALLAAILIDAEVQ